MDARSYLKPLVEVNQATISLVVIDLAIWCISIIIGKCIGIGSTLGYKVTDMVWGEDLNFFFKTRLLATASKIHIIL